MSPTEETWTPRHDLALVYLALAQGTDKALADTELHLIVSLVQGWDATLRREEAQEIVLEAMAIFMEDEGGLEVSRTIRSLKKTLDPAGLAHALQDVVRIAEADGVLLSSETGMISILADVWGLRDLGSRLLAHTQASVAEEPAWSLLHDMALLSIVLAHSTDNDLSAAEIDAIPNRLGLWQPDLAPEAVLEIVREALRSYSAGPDRELLENAIRSVRDTLPPIQRIAFLDDLMHIAQSDGHLHPNEEGMMHDLSKAWGVDVRLSGRRTVAG